MGIVSILRDMRDRREIESEVARDHIEENRYFIDATQIYFDCIKEYTEKNTNMFARFIYNILVGIFLTLLLAFKLSWQFLIVQTNLPGVVDSFSW